MDTLDDRVGRLESHVNKLDKDIVEIRTMLGVGATKEDVAALHTHIDHSINDLLSEALKSVPQKAMVAWTIVLTIITGLGLLASIIHHV